MMRSRSLVSAVFLMLVACAPSVPPTQGACPTAGGEAVSDPSQTIDEDLRELLVLTHALDLAKQVADPMIAALSKNYPQVPVELWQQLAQEMDAEPFTALVVDSYRQHLSHDDVRALLRFYRSDAGKNMVEAMPKIVATSQEAGRRWGLEIAAKLLEGAKKQGYEL